MATDTIDMLRNLRAVREAGDVAGFAREVVAEAYYLTLGAKRIAVDACIRGGCSYAYIHARILDEQSVGEAMGMAVQRVLTDRLSRDLSTDEIATFLPEIMLILFGEGGVW